MHITEKNDSRTEFVVNRKNIRKPVFFSSGDGLESDEGGGPPPSPSQSEEEEAGQVAGEDLRESRAARHSRR